MSFPQVIASSAPDQRRREASFAFIFAKYTKSPELAYIAGYARGTSIKFAPIEILPTIYDRLHDVGEDDDDVRTGWNLVCT